MAASIPFLLENGYRTIAPDLRGFGRSSRPDGTEKYTASHLIGDVIGLLDRLSVQRAHFVAHDWGAAIAWMIAAQVPERVSSLTALSVGHPAAFRAAGLPQREKSWYVLLFQFAGVAEEWLSGEDFHNFRLWAEHPDSDEVVARLKDPAALTASLSLYRAILPPEWLITPNPAFPVPVPVMGVFGTADMGLCEEQMTDSELYVAGTWRYERLVAAGHWLPLETPDKINSLLLDFLSGHRADGHSQ